SLTAWVAFMASSGQWRRESGSRVKSLGRIRREQGRIHRRATIDAASLRFDSCGQDGREALQFVARRRAFFASRPQLQATTQDASKRARPVFAAVQMQTSAASDWNHVIHKM
ncbi:MAG: hypothetical protein ABI870_13485, partial [Rhodanobacter sp.]